MPQSEKRTQELLQKASSLPQVSGIYIMKDKVGNVIYVGKSRKLKNRVSQYFQNSRKSIKTEKMVRYVEDFEYILCSSEIEALTLENTLIKQHSPKYNIKLKDAKAYPYIKITSGQYPRLVYTRKRAADRARYFGPFTGTSTVYTLLDTIRKSFGIPSCHQEFPRDIGKRRPCIYYQMNQCCGVCTGKVTPEEYNELIRCAADILRGNVSASIKMLEAQMLDFSEQEKYEAAAKCRDTIKALNALKEKQHVVSAPGSEQDVFGIYSDERCTCISVMYVRDGAVIDKSDYVYGANTIVDSGTLSSFIAEHYQIHDYIPKNILLSFELEEEDMQMLEAFLADRAEHKITIKTPERGDLRKLCDTVNENAAEKARQYVLDANKHEEMLAELASLLHLEVLPERIEAYDISNIGSESKVCGMVVAEGGKLNKSEYRLFNIKSVEGTDDYASMREALGRRIERMKEVSVGGFAKIPDLILLDGGRGHVSVVKELMREMGVDIPVFGMVKDEYHKTRALCNENDEINIAKNKSVFIFIYSLQEEVHRFSVSKSSRAKISTLKRSSLENIEGIGKAKAAILLAEFGGLAQIKRAETERLASTKGISRADAERIYTYFHDEK